MMLTLRAIKTYQSVQTLGFFDVELRVPWLEAKGKPSKRGRPPTARRGILDAIQRVDQPDLPPGPLRTDRAAKVIDAGRLNSEDQNLKRPKTNQPQRIKRQENTNRRSHHETIHTENRTATINPTPNFSCKRFP